MQRIHIKPDAVTQSIKLIPFASISNAHKTLTITRNSLDQRILKKNNIHLRLQHTIQELTQIERKLRELEKFTLQSMERYTQVETTLAHRLAMLDEMSSKQIPPSIIAKQDNWQNTRASTALKAWDRRGDDSNAKKNEQQLDLEDFAGPPLTEEEIEILVGYLQALESGEITPNVYSFKDMPEDYSEHMHNIFGQPVGLFSPFPRLSRGFISGGLDFVPGVGNVKSLAEAGFGKDFIVGRELEGWERWLALAGVVGGGVGKLVGKGVPKAVGWLGDVKSGGRKAGDLDVKGKSNLEVPFTKEQLATKPSYSPAPDKWTKKGGTVKIDEDGTWVYTNKKGQTVRYPDGYPDFTKYAHPTVKPVEIEIARPTNRPLDYKNANIKAGLDKDSNPPVPLINKPPLGYIWHHHQDGKTMVLVQEKIHAEFTHAGGVSRVNKSR